MDICLNLEVVERTTKVAFILFLEIYKCHGSDLQTDSFSLNDKISTIAAIILSSSKQIIKVTLALE